MAEVPVSSSTTVTASAEKSDDRLLRWRGLRAEAALSSMELFRESPWPRPCAQRQCCQIGAGRVFGSGRSGYRERLQSCGAQARLELLHPHFTPPFTPVPPEGATPGVSAAGRT